MLGTLCAGVPQGPAPAAGSKACDGYMGVCMLGCGQRSMAAAQGLMPGGATCISALCASYGPAAAMWVAGLCWVCLGPQPAPQQQPQQQ